MPSSPSNSHRRTMADEGPYLTHIVRHHGQLTLIPPDTAGRIRQPNPKSPRHKRSSQASTTTVITPIASTKPSARMRMPRDRSAGSPSRRMYDDVEEGGVHSVLGSQAVHDREEGPVQSTPMTPPRHRRPASVVEEDFTIPDFPPPTFEEAIASSPPQVPQGTPYAHLIPLPMSTASLPLLSARPGFDNDAASTVYHEDDFDSASDESEDEFENDGSAASSASSFEQQVGGVRPPVHVGPARGRAPGPRMPRTGSRATLAAQPRSEAVGIAETIPEPYPVGLHHFANSTATLRMVPENVSPVRRVAVGAPLGQGGEISRSTSPSRSTSGWAHGEAVLPNLHAPTRSSPLAASPTTVEIASSPLRSQTPPRSSASTAGHTPRSKPMRLPAVEDIPPVPAIVPRTSGENSRQAPTDIAHAQPAKSQDSRGAALYKGANASTATLLAPRRSSESSRGQASGSQAAIPPIPTLSDESAPRPSTESSRTHGSAYPPSRPGQVASSNELVAPRRSSESSRSQICGPTPTVPPVPSFPLRARPSDEDGWRHSTVTEHESAPGPASSSETVDASKVSSSEPPTPPTPSSGFRIGFGGLWAPRSRSPPQATPLRTPPPSPSSTVSRLARKLTFHRDKNREKDREADKDKAKDKERPKDKGKERSFSPVTPSPLASPKAEDRWEIIPASDAEASLRSPVSPTPTHCSPPSALSLAGNAKLHPVAAPQERPPPIVRDPSTKASDQPSPPPSPAPHLARLRLGAAATASVLSLPRLLMSKVDGTKTPGAPSTVCSPTTTKVAPARDDPAPSSRQSPVTPTPSSPSTPGSAGYQTAMPSPTGTTGSTATVTPSSSGGSTPTALPSTPVKRRPALPPPLRNRVRNAPVDIPHEETPLSDPNPAPVQESVRRSWIEPDVDPASIPLPATPVPTFIPSAPTGLPALRALVAAQYEERSPSPVFSLYPSSISSREHEGYSTGDGAPCTPTRRHYSGRPLPSPPSTPSPGVQPLGPRPPAFPDLHSLASRSSMRSHARSSSSPIRRAQTPHTEDGRRDGVIFDLTDTADRPRSLDIVSAMRNLASGAHDERERWSFEQRWRYNDEHERWSTTSGWREAERERWSAANQEPERWSSTPMPSATPAASGTWSMYDDAGRPRVPWQPWGQGIPAGNSYPTPPHIGPAVSIPVAEPAPMARVFSRREDGGDEESSGDEESMRRFENYTDLDALVASMGEADDGSNYETLQLVSEFIGPAENARQNQQEADVDPPFVGKIEVTRRRVTKDGRVKLKLALLGVDVDRCGICFSQFKDDEWAALGAACRHSFHERCLTSWMKESRTCPICRVSFGSPCVP